MNQPGAQASTATGGIRPVGTVVIRPTRGWAPLRIRELWGHRELLTFLVWRDVRVRYRQTVLGAAWAILQPFTLMVVFAVFLGRLARVPSDGLPYPIFAYAGLVPWTLFASSLTASSASLVSNAHLISKVYFPRLILPVAATGVFLLDFAISMTVLAGMMAFYGIAPGIEALWLPAFTLMAMLAALAVGVALSAVNVRHRDVRHAVPLLVQLWLFASPVAYPSSIVPEAWRGLYALNPMAGVVDGFRWALLGAGPPPAATVLLSAAVTALVLLAGLAYFRRVERTFADEI